jgi:nucleoid-associated protein YgaU
MPAGGKLEKMLVLAFKDAAAAETGDRQNAAATFEALINPESYVHEYKVKYADAAQAPGTSGQEVKYERTEPDEMTFEFLFDNTGIIDGKKRDSIADDLQKFREMLIGYKGESHQPYTVKLVWGTAAIFKGRAVELSINYKIFSPDGLPLRAIIKVKFKSTVEDKKRASESNDHSPDLTHTRIVKSGDTLPLMCSRIYGEPTYYLQVARFNRLDNFRWLEPGIKILFPSISKSTG